MTVAHILKSKGNTVITVTSATTLKEVADTLAHHRIGAVVVSDGKGGIAGIVSERDVVRALAAHGAQVTGKKASEIMTARVHTCTPRDSETDLMALMTQQRIRHVPVIEDGKLAGMISIGDVVKNRIESIEREAEHMKTYIASAG